MKNLLLAALGGMLICIAPCGAQQSRTYQVKPLSAPQNTYLDSSISQTAGGGASVQRHGLPNTIYGPAVGRPGDPVSKGVFQGNPNQSGAIRAGQNSIGLPPCRPSECVKGFGDSIRSDLGRRIDGTPVRQRRVGNWPAQQQFQQRPLQDQPVASYSSPLQPAYRRGRSY
jgi:hypothetical protein